MIRVGFSTTDSFWSRVIRRATGSDASHTWLLLDDQCAGSNLVLGADEGGFRLVPYAVFVKGHRVTECIDPGWDLAAGVAAAMPLLGERYDYGGALGMGLVLAGRRARRRLRNPLYSARALFCSEAVALVLQKSLMPGAAELEPEDCSPEDIRSFVKGAALSPAA